ncbi:MAG: iron-sulfur cluster assembly accessory protein, partial [Planctomycetaceae bacterium]|nr:iron-sulfur cluster assembly accessory protein [Planctomycetaceae bacterium]
MGVILSEKAANEVKRLITAQNLPEGTMLRVGVQGGGCSGLSYSLNFDTNTTESDRVVDIHGLKLAMD